MSDADSDKDVPGLIEYAKSGRVVDSVVNRKSYRLAYVAGRTLTDALGMEMGFRWVYSRLVDHWVIALCRVLPGDVYVPLMLVHQEEFGNIFQLACDDTDHDCHEFMDVEGSAPKPEAAETFAAFLPLVQSLYGDPAIPDSAEAQKLSEFYIVENREEGEGDGKG